MSVGVSERRVIFAMSFRSPDKACVTQECANERANRCHGSGAVRGSGGARARLGHSQLIERPFEVPQTR